MTSLSGAAVQAGQLELNVMMPVVSFNLLFMITILANAIRAVRAGAIEGIKADAARCRMYAETSLGLVTAVAPLIGYAEAAGAAEEARRTRRPVATVLREKGILDEATLARLLDPAAMTGPGTAGKVRKRAAKTKAKAKR